MKKAMQISIGGMHFHIDEDAYALLGEYTDSLREYFAKEGDASKEIIDDIENRMAELLSSRITDSKQVVSLDDIKEIINILGKIEEFEFETPADESANPQEDTEYNRKEYRRLYRDPDNSILGGVCSGLAAYFNIEIWIVRLIFIFLAFFNIILHNVFSLLGVGVILYVVLWIVIPKARTTAQKLQMRGEPVTVETIKRSVNKEYRKVKSSVSNIGHSDGFRQGANVIEELFKAFGRVILVFLKVFVYVIGFFFLLAGLILLAGVVTAVFTHHHWVQHFDWPQIYIPNLSDFFSDPTSITIVAVCAIILIAIPIISLIVWGIKLLVNIRGSNRVLQASAVTIWVIALIVLIAMIFTESNSFAFQASSSDDKPLKPTKASTIYLELKDMNNVLDGITVYSIFDYDIYYDKEKEKILGKPELNISESQNHKVELILTKKIRNIGMKDADDFLEDIDYNWNQRDSILIFDNYFSMDEKNKWRFAEVELTLRIPKNQKIQISKSMAKILDSFWLNETVGRWEAYDRKLIMTDSGLKFAEE